VRAVDQVEAGIGRRLSMFQINLHEEHTPFA
jgi:hypothetical protein